MPDIQKIQTAISGLEQLVEEQKSLGKSNPKRIRPEELDVLREFVEGSNNCLAEQDYIPIQENARMRLGLNRDKTMGLPLILDNHYQDKPSAETINKAISYLTQISQAF